MLAHRDVCSREPLFRRYDWVVRGATVIPRGAADAGVLAPDSGLDRSASRWPSPAIRATAASTPRAAAQLAVLEAVRRTIAVGARPLGLTDCLNFGNPHKPERYRRARRGDRRAGTGGARVRLGVRFRQRQPLQRVEVRRSDSAVGDRRVHRSLSRRRAHDHAGTQTRRLRRYCGWAAASSRSAARCWPTVLGIDGPLPAIDYEGERAAIGIVQSRDFRGRAACRAAPSSDGGMLTALARLAFDARAAGRELGAELDFGNPLCEAGGFLCEVSDDERSRRVGALEGRRRRSTTAETRSSTQRHSRSMHCTRSGRSRWRRSIRERARLPYWSFRERTRKTRRCGCCAIAAAMPNSCTGRARNAGAFDAYVLPGRIRVRGSHSRRRGRGARRSDGRRDDRRSRPASWCSASATARRCCSRPDSCRAPARHAGRPRPSRTTAPVPHFVCRHVYLKLAIEPTALRDYRGAAAGSASIPAYAAHGEGPLGGVARSILPRSSPAIISRSSTPTATGAYDGERRSQRVGARLRGTGERGRQRAGDHAASGARRVELQSSRSA